MSQQEEPVEKPVEGNTQLQKIGAEESTSESLPAIIEENNDVAIDVKRTDFLAPIQENVTIRGFSPIKVDGVLVNNINNYPFLERNTQLALLDTVSKSGLGSKNISELEMIVNFGISLGIPPITALNNIIVNNGKLIMYYHLMNSLCINSGVVSIQVIKDYEPLVDKAGAVVNRVTQIRFIRRLKNNLPDYEYLSTYYMTEAKTAGLLEKDVWKKHTKQMMFARCFAGGARVVAPDIIGGGVYVEGEF